MSGRYRHKITLQTRAETLNTLGEATLAYTDLASVWAHMVAVSAQERLQNQQITAQVTHRFTFLRASAYDALKPSDRISYDGRTFDIQHVLDKMGRGREIEVTARENV